MMSDKIIPIYKDTYKNIKSMGDFYKVVGIKDSIPKGFKVDVQKIHMDKNDCKELQNIIYNNLLNDDYYKDFTDSYLKRCVAMDWLCFSPNTVKKVASGYLLLEDGYMFERGDIDAEK